MKTNFQKWKKNFKNFKNSFPPNFDFSYGENVAIWSPNKSELFCDVFGVQKKIRNKRKMFGKMFSSLRKISSNFYPLNVAFLFVVGQLIVRYVPSRTTTNVTASTGKRWTSERPITMWTPSTAASRDRPPRRRAALSATHSTFLRTRFVLAGKLASLLSMKWRK